jgi:hypothetical protein
MSADLDAFGAESSRRLVALAAVSALVFSANPIVGAAVSTVLIYRELSRIQSQVLTCYLTPVIGTLTESLSAARTAPDLARLGSAVDSLHDARGSRSAASVTTTRFERQRRSQYDVVAEYRNVTAADAGTPGIAGVVSTARDLDGLISRIRSLFRMDATTSVLPTAPARRIMAPIPARYLSLASVSPTTVQGSASDSSGLWMLRFDAQTVTANIPLQVSVRYQPPGRATQVTTRSITLTPDSVGIYTQAVQGEWAWGVKVEGSLTPFEATFGPAGVARYRYRAVHPDSNCGGPPGNIPKVVDGYCEYRGSWAIKTMTLNGTRRYYLADGYPFRAGGFSPDAVVEPLTTPLGSFGVRFSWGALERTYTR